MKREIRIFVCYAHRNQKTATEFIERFKDYVSPSKNFKYIFWRDVELLVGQDWNHQIEQNLENCDCAILLLSTAFLNSNYIKKIEIPHLQDAQKLIFPVALSKLNFEKHDLFGLEKYQIFRLEHHDFSEAKEYNSLSNEGRKDEFVDRLFVQIEKQLDSFYSKN